MSVKEQTKDSPKKLAADINEEKVPEDESHNRVQLEAVSGVGSVGVVV